MTAVCRLQIAILQPFFFTDNFKITIFWLKKATFCYTFGSRDPFLTVVDGRFHVIYLLSLRFLLISQ